MGQNKDVRALALLGVLLAMATAAVDHPLDSVVSRWQQTATLARALTTGVVHALDIHSLTDAPTPPCTQGAVAKHARTRLRVLAFRELGSPGRVLIIRTAPTRRHCTKS
jgi:hypothetical protein